MPHPGPEETPAARRRTALAGAWRRYHRQLLLLPALLLYLCLAAYQVGLPGLHYDEAKEAGVNALELLTGAPVTAFRDAAVDFGGWRLPLMVQDYIGALNVYLALPFLALTGIGVPNLRALSILEGLAALLLLERAVTAWWSLAAAAPSFSLVRLTPNARAGPPSIAGLFAVYLLAASPSFVFWSRQGIFVTNLVQALTFLCLWQVLAWLRTGRLHRLILGALAAGLALNAKLVAVWVLAPFVLMAGGWWMVGRLRGRAAAPGLSWAGAFAAAAAFLLGVAPLLVFNAKTGGTFAAIAGNLGQGYYGADNRDVLASLATRWPQLQQVLRGDQFWYLGGIYANRAAPWLAAVAIAAGLLRRWRLVAPPLGLLAAAFGLSLFTISDLFITHYALLQPLLAGVIGVAAAVWVDGAPAAYRGWARPQVARVARWCVAGGVVVWLLLDLSASLQYHRALTNSGGLADHSDASYHLADYLQNHGLGAPIALDWGIEAPVRYLSQGTVKPIEIFGYASPSAPDTGFIDRVGLFLANPANVYLLHAPGSTVFQGRRELFLAEAARRNLTPAVETTVTQRDGTPLFEVWRVTPELPNQARQ